VTGNPSMSSIVEGDISMIEALRTELAGRSRSERRALIRGLGTPWLRMAVAMSGQRWKDAKAGMRSAAAQIDAQV
jgi:hypothetical protein